MFSLVLSLALPADPGHYVFSGPLSSLMVEGSTIGNSTTGIPFTVNLTDNGNKIAPTDFDLKGSGWNNPIHIHLTDAKFSSGHLTGKINFKNESGKVLEGLRLDLGGARETYEDHGQAKLRPEAATMPSPLLFADLQLGDDADAQPIDVSGITFTSETKEVDVTFMLSGLAYLGAFTVPRDSWSPGALSVDSQGRVYVTDHNSGLWRFEGDGTQPQLVGKWGDNTDYAFVDPATGDLVGHESNSHRIIVDSASGEEKSKVPASEEFGRWPSWARTNGTGTLYVAEENHVAIYKNGNKVKDLETVGGTAILNSDAHGDVAPDGTLYTYSDGSIYRSNPDLTDAKKIAFGPDWHLGRVTNVQSLRVDSAGNLYVLEDNAEGWAEWPRVSVFDRNGHFVRVFGRAGKAPKEGDDVLEGAVGKTMYDAAIGKDGRIYITTDVAFGRILMFQPF